MDWTRRDVYDPMTLWVIKTGGDFFLYFTHHELDPCPVAQPVRRGDDDRNLETRQARVGSQRLSEPVPFSA